ncbi:MAG: TonB-dependent receptor domain-containing protein [Prevotella sp.]
MLLILSVAPLTAAAQEQNGLVSGRITAKEGETIDFATVTLKGTGYATRTQADGLYHLKAPAGKYILNVVALGYATAERTVELKAGERLKLNINLSTDAKQLDELHVTGSGVSRVNRSAYNAVAVDARRLHNTTQNLSDALSKAPGMKLREAGGVGSDMQFTMDGFTGRNVKVFIDGIPQEGVGSSFGLNNIPVTFADRIEVYRGVVPVGFGTDALGGVVNIVTRRERKPLFLDASYSFGSFNTHKGNIRFGQNFKNGMAYELHFFANYSDNSYRTDTPVEHFLEDGSSMLNSKKYESVKRFHDTYHNEAVTAKVGVRGKSFADKLMVGFTYAHNYKEQQNGVVQKVVFGEKHSKGYSVMPAIEYAKRNLFVKNLDLTVTANYNHNITQNIDTATYHFNWLGEKQYMGGQAGEQQYQDSRSRNSNWNATATLNYRIGDTHTFTFSEVTNNFRRKRTDAPGSTDTQVEAQAMDKRTEKNIMGLAYRLMLSEKWNVSVFGKYYHQHNSGPVSTSQSGTSDYVRLGSSTDALGYGAAGTYFIIGGLQAKVSYEKAYRLPTNDELFGDESLELSAMDLRPERSHNANASISYDTRMARHGIYAEVGYVYRDTRDYIQRTIGTYSGNKQYASYQNHGRVKTTGWNASARYSYGSLFSLGGTFTRMDVRDNVRTLSEGSLQANPTYKARIPNLPYEYANMDATVNINGLFDKRNTLSVTYDNYYAHSFPLYSENLGTASAKNIVPKQFAHNITVTYSMRHGRYNVSLECRNFTDEKLYDNFSLQKAGRAFYGKVRVNL